MKKTPAIKILAAAAALFLGTTGAQATVTVTFGSASIYASNWANTSDTTGGTLVWGILIDTSGNGFRALDGGYAGVGVNLTAGVYQPMPDGAFSQQTDDLLYLSPALMNTVAISVDGGVVGQNRITGIANIPLIDGVSTGDHFAIVWFNSTTLNGSSVINQRFGFFDNAAFTIPPDGNTVPFTSVFTGPDSLKLMNGQLVPEPSTLLLSALGALALIRRRR